MGSLSSFLAVLIAAFVATVTIDVVESSYVLHSPDEHHRLDLVPTAWQVTEERRRKRRRKLKRQHQWQERYLDDRIDLDWEDSKIRKNNAVYASLSEPEYEDLTPEEIDFHRHRHLSRYERQYRTERGIDLQLDWDGRYETSPNGAGSSRSNTTAEKLTSRHLQRRYSTAAHTSNAYQVAPLSQGYGTHYAYLWVGSPKPQRKTVIVDTGSHYTAFPCKGCEDCGLEHHTDSYFDPSISETFRPLLCHECLLAAKCQNYRCTFRQAYTEGSAWEAYQVRDLLYLGGKDVLASADPKNEQYAIDFMFGCQTSANGLFITQLADGIMGLSAHEMTIVKQLYDRNKIPQNVFSLCFKQELGTSKQGVTAGVMTLGGTDARLDSSPTIFAENVVKSGWFTVFVKNIFIRVGGGQSATSITTDGEHILKIPLDYRAVNSGKGVIVDSGTTDTYLSKKLAKQFSAVWKQVTKKEYSNTGIILTDEQLRQLPTILVQCRATQYRPDPSLGDPNTVVGLTGDLDPTSPYDVLIAIPATHYMEYSPTTNLYTSRLYFTETHGGVLGANSMQGHNVVFDWEHGRVGFAESTCDYEDENSSDILEEYTDEPESVRISNSNIDDCVLSAPILTRSCVESIDSRVCKQPGTRNSFVVGTEIWTFRVEQAGTDSGMSCVDTVLLESPFRGNLPPSVECGGDGICTEHRPCEIPCPDVVKAEQLLVEDSNDYCPARWSGCDHGCTQSIIVAHKKSDGNCHEMDRGSRPCHKQACGWRDHCRVPYMLQATLGFRGGRLAFWVPRFSELLAVALVETVNQKIDSKQPYFTEGDVNVIMVAPWREQEGANDSEKELGIKVVFQISFYNENAKLLTEEEEEPETVAPVDDGSDTDDEDNRKLSSVNLMFKRSSRIKSTCLEADLYNLAKNAHKVHSVLEEEDFMKILIGALQGNEGGEHVIAVSPFQNLYSNIDLIPESIVLSSWTVRTEAEEMYRWSNGLVPGKIRQYAFNIRYLMAFICISAVVCGWIYERKVQVQVASARYVYAVMAAWEARRASRSRRREHDDEALFEKLFSSEKTSVSTTGESGTIQERNGARDSVNRGGGDDGELRRTDLVKRNRK